MRRALAAVADGKGSHPRAAAGGPRAGHGAQAGELPPEQMLLHIKEIFAEAGMRRTTRLHRLDGPPSDGVMVYQDVIAWSIRSYYEGGNGSVGGS